MTEQQFPNKSVTITGEVRPLCPHSELLLNRKAGVSGDGLWQALLVRECSLIILPSSTV